MRKKKATHGKPVTDFSVNMAGHLLQKQKYSDRDITNLIKSTGRHMYPGKVYSLKYSNGRFMPKDGPGSRSNPKAVTMAKSLIKKWHLNDSQIAARLESKELPLSAFTVGTIRESMGRQAKAKTNTLANPKSPFSPIAVDNVKHLIQQCKFTDSKIAKIMAAKGVQISIRHVGRIRKSMGAAPISRSGVHLDPATISRAKKLIGQKSFTDKAISVRMMREGLLISTSSIKKLRISMHFPAVGKTSSLSSKTVARASELIRLGTLNDRDISKLMAPEELPISTSSIGRLRRSMGVPVVGNGGGQPKAVVSKKLTKVVFSVNLKSVKVEGWSTMLERTSRSHRQNSLKTLFEAKNDLEKVLLKANTKANSKFLVKLANIELLIETLKKVMKKKGELER